MDIDRRLTTAGIARLADVRDQTVRRWKMDNKDFPEPVQWYGNTAVYRREDILDWLTRHGKKVAE